MNNLNVNQVCFIISLNISVQLANLYFYILEFKNENKKNRD